MFGFFKRKPKTIPPEWQGFADRFLGPMAMSVALAQTAAKHAEAIRAGNAAFPAHKEEGASVLRIWHGLRLESCIQAVAFSNGAILDLAAVGRQHDVLASLLDGRAHLMFPQPVGSPADHSIQAMWQVYLHLSEVGTDVCDHLTDRHVLRFREKDIMTDIESDAAALRVQWRALLRGEDGGGVPRTLFDLFFDDLNRKTKSIAFSTVFGPEPDKAIPEFLAKVREVRGAEFAANYEAELTIIRAADNPDQATERLDDFR